MSSSKSVAIGSWVAAAGFFLTAAGHASSFGKYSHDPALWFVFPIQQVVLGLTVLLVARVSPNRPTVFFLTAAAPLAESALMFRFLGAIIPSFCVLTSGVLPTIAGLLSLQKPNQPRSFADQRVREI